MDIESRDPAWRYWVQTTKRELEGKLGSTFALSNGMLGLRGAHEECPAWGRPEFYVAGTYTGGPASLLGFHDPDHILAHPGRLPPTLAANHDDIATLPNLPFPVGLRIAVDGIAFAHDTHKVLSAERLLEIDHAMLRRTLVFRDDAGRRTRVDSTRFVSLADPHLVCLRATIRRLNHDAPASLQGFLHEDVANTNGVRLWTAGERLSAPGMRGLACVPSGGGPAVALVQCEQLVEEGEGGAPAIELFAVAGAMPLAEARQRAEAARADGFDACAAAHKSACAQALRASRVEFDGLPSTVQGFHFGQLHLHMAASPIAERTGVPIKGLTGHGYRFLVFWDMDFHMFPYYLLTQPRFARKLLEYRFSQLPRYRENARRWGAKGAQVPWETNTRGVEETAPWLCLQDREIHISADAAFMFKRYADVTGDTAVIRDMGAEFAFETARFYASRLRWNGAMDRYELPDIGCPDQYHTFADNNVFISLWAQWNLAWAAELAAQPAHAAVAARVGLDAAEAATWREMADKLWIIEPNAEGIVEEFEGYFDLDPDLDGICETYCRHSQAVKQPDVLAAFIPFEDRYPAEIRRRNWRYYHARTLHGSSLSLPGMAYAAARCGLNDEALHALHQSCRMDLDDVNLDTERGVHVSGGAVQWCAVVHGFGGLDATAEGLTLRPNLPRPWNRLAFTVQWHFQRVDIEITPEAVLVAVGTDEPCPVPVRIGDGEWRVIGPGESVRSERQCSGFAGIWG